MKKVKYCSEHAGHFPCPWLNVGYNYCNEFKEKVEYDSKEGAYKRCVECMIHEYGEV